MCIWNSSWPWRKRTTPIRTRRASSRTPELVAQVRRGVADGFQVCCVQESCGFGFVLHRELVAAGAEFSASRPSRSTGNARPTSWTRARCGLRLSRWLDGNRDELRRSAFRVRRNNASATARGGGSSWGGRSGRWPITGTGRWPSIATPNCRTLVGRARLEEARRTGRLGAGSLTQLRN